MKEAISLLLSRSTCNVSHNIIEAKSVPDVWMSNGIMMSHAILLEHQ